MSLTHTLISVMHKNIAISALFHLISLHIVSRVLAYSAHHSRSILPTTSIKNGVPKVDFKGFMVDNAHANWNVVRRSTMMVNHLI